MAQCPPQHRTLTLGALIYARVRVTNEPRVTVHRLHLALTTTRNVGFKTVHATDNDTESETTTSLH